MPPPRTQSLDDPAASAQPRVPPPVLQLSEKGATTANTADRADNYLRLTATVAELRRMFADYVPTDTELAKVGHAADFAFDQVAARVGIAESEQDQAYHDAENYLE